MSEADTDSIRGEGGGEEEATMLFGNQDCD